MLESENTTAGNGMNHHWHLPYLEATPPPLICGIGGFSQHMELTLYRCPGFRGILAPLPN